MAEALEESSEIGTSEGLQPRLVFWGWERRVCVIQEGLSQPSVVQIVFRVSARFLGKPRGSK